MSPVFLLPPSSTSTSPTPASGAILPGSGTWAGYPLLSLIPEVHQTLDADVNGNFISFLSAFLPIWDYYREKIRDMGDLRDPLRAPADTSFNRPVIILKVDDLGDGTSRVFLSQGVDGDKLDDLRPGMVLTDYSGSRFNVLEINASGLPTEFSNPPIDPFTGNETGKHIIVRNISLTNLEHIPAVSGYLIENENPTSTDDGIATGPYTFTVTWDPIALNLVTVTWTESAVTKTGYFNNQGQFSGQLRAGSSINFTTGQIIIDPANGIAVDNDSIRVTYTTKQIYKENPTPTPVDNGTNLAPYLFTTGYPPLALHKVTLEWKEATVVKTGSFDSAGVPSGQLNVSSTINFTTGQISLVNAGGAAIDTDSIRVSYLSSIVLSPTDAVINAQHILAFLGADYGVTLDRHDPETLQRSYVYHAYRLWDLKGSQEGYEILGKMAGFIVRPSRLYRISVGMLGSLSGLNYYEYSSGFTYTEDPGSAVDNYIIPPDDGISEGLFMIQVSNPAIYSAADIILTWTEDVIAKTATLTSTNTITGTNAADILSFSATRTVGQIFVKFQSGKAPDAGSVRVTYTQSAYYTDVDPDTVVMDDVILDVTPLDSFCFDTEELYPSSPHYPTVKQFVSVTSVTSLGTEGSKTRYRVVVDTTAFSSMHVSLGTDGTFVDFANNYYFVENFERLTSSTYRFEVLDTVAPVTGDAVVKWQAIKTTPYQVTDDPGTTATTSISPAENGSNLGPFSIQLAYYPLEGTQGVTLNWKRGTVAKTATLSGTTGSTISGADAGELSSASLNRTSGMLTLTFAATFPPDADSIRVTYVPNADASISGVGGDVMDLGVEFVGYTGRRYKWSRAFLGPLPIGNVGHWKLIDAAGKQAWIEKVTLIGITPITGGEFYSYYIEFIMDQPPATGPVNIFYVCELYPSCAFCAASAIRLTIEPDAILNYPTIDVNDAADRLIERLKEMIPGHVRIADFELV